MTALKMAALKGTPRTTSAAISMMQHTHLRVFLMHVLSMLVTCAVLTLNTGCSVPAKLAAADKQPAVYQPRIPADWNRAQHPQHTSYHAHAAVQEWPDDWWLVFNDPQLTRLIHTAQTNNADLLQAALKIQEAQLQINRAQRARKPTYSGSLSASASKSLARSDSPVHRSFSSSFGVSYQLDLWGKLRDNADMAQWQKTATVEDLRGVQLTQTTHIAQAYWQLQRLHAQTQALLHTINQSKETLRLATVRHTAGAAARMDVVASEQALLATQQQTIDLREQIQQNERTLAILTGQPPHTPLQLTPSAQLHNATLPPLPALPLHLPASLLQRRPDLAAAQQRLRITLAGIQVARNAFYPDINLNGGISAGGNTLLKILSNPSASLSAALNLPVFKQAENQLQHKQAKLQYQNALLQFKTSLYNALKEVENARTTRTSLQAKQRSLEEQLAHTRTLERMHKVRYLAGETTIEPWLNAQQNTRNAKHNLLENRFAQYQNAITLYAALGGSTSIPDVLVPALEE